MSQGNGEKEGKGSAQRSTARQGQSEDQPGPSHPVSEDDTPDLPSQMIQPNNDDHNENILRYHADMVVELSEMFALDSNEWKSICSIVKMLKYVSTRDMGDVKDMFDLCDALKKKGKIDYGEYSKLRDILVKCNVDAGSTIDKSTDKIRQERQGQSQAKRQMPEEDLGQIPTKRQKTGGNQDGDRKLTAMIDGDRKLTAMIETTTAVILREKDEYEFICTKSLQDAFAKLKQNGLVIIKGNSGDGKTSIALELLRRLCYNEEGQQLRLPLELHDVKDLDSVAPKSQLVIYFDDVFGKNVVCKQDVEEWEKKEKSIIAKFSGDENTGGNFLIIAIRSGISNSLTGSSLEKLFTAQNTVDVNIDAEEKLEFLRLYQPKDNFVSWKESEEKEIVKCAPDIGFPQCCRLFRDSASLQSERVNFFRRPFHFLKSSLSKLKDGKCYGLMYLFLNGGKVMEEDLDSGSENIDQNVLKAAFANDVVRVTQTTEHVHNMSNGRKIEFVKESLDCLLGWMVKKEQKQKVCYKFSHDSIEETLALLYGEKTPIGFIQNCPSKFLSCVTTSKTTPNKVVISSSNEHMYKRLLREFESVSDRFHSRFSGRYSKYNSITSLDVWTDVQFLRGFITWLSGQNVDKNLRHVIKLRLLNGACYSGLEERALCLLSEGVEPDKETPFCVVKGGSMSLLRKLLEYDVTLTARVDESLSSRYGKDINVLQEACLCEREEMVTVLYNTYPHLVHHTAMLGRSTLQLVALTGNCDIFKTVERFILKSLCRVEDEQHKCERVEGGVVHRNCVCAQYMSGLVNRWGWTVLHYSCSEGHREVSRYLCETYPTLTTAVDRYGQTALHYSCMFGRREVIRYLCETYPTLTTAVTNTGQTVLHYSCWAGHREVSRYLCETYPTLTTVVDGRGRHCLHHIARSRLYWSHRLDMFTECETRVKQYLESTGRKYDITTILTNQGESVLDIAKEWKERRGRENDPLYDHLVQLFGQDKH